MCSSDLGARIDGVPVEDALGDSNGFRRPGYAIAVQPMLQWMKSRYNLSLATPVIVKYRDDKTDSRTELEKWIR